ncbi:Beta-galactosidase C-terminal domain [Nonomuraea angiospora]|uniref:Beta-galactosidase C-terminal domain n=1 Tax=Nonomuraea angiospora TaxID=46172 RepID=UPI00341F3BF2
MGAPLIRAGLPDLPPSVEAVRRGDVLFLLNHGTDTARVPLPGPATDLLSRTHTRYGPTSPEHLRSSRRVEPPGRPDKALRRRQGLHRARTVTRQADGRTDAQWFADQARGCPSRTVIDVLTGKWVH